MRFQITHGASGETLTFGQTFAEPHQYVCSLLLSPQLLGASLSSYPQLLFASDLTQVDFVTGRVALVAIPSSTHSFGDNMHNDRLGSDFHLAKRALTLIIDRAVATSRASCWCCVVASISTLGQLYISIR